MHPTGSTRLVDAGWFIQGFLEGVGRLGLTANGLAELAIGFVEFRGWIIGFRFQATLLFNELLFHESEYPPIEMVITARHTDGSVADWRIVKPIKDITSEDVESLTERW